MTYRGMTLIETVVTVALTLIIFLALGSMIIYFYRTNAYTLQQSTAVGQARRGVEDAMRYLRQSSYGSDGSYPIEVAATSSITFYTNTDSDSAIERVTYLLLNGVLYRTIQNPSGNPLSYVGASTATSTVAVSVVNGTSTPVFRYFDNTGSELAQPVNVSRVASVRTTVIIDVDVNRAPVAFTLSGGATLRNLRNQP
ncbi:MAG: hypothetical protein WAN50_04645 [Minisyncoccia bacterium]